MVYIVSRKKKSITIWKGGSSYPINPITYSDKEIFGVFVNSNRHVYFGVENSVRKVINWTLPPTNSVSQMNIEGNCYGLFIDINNTLYCSMQDKNQVIIKRWNSSINGSRIVIGNRNPGKNPDELDDPRGIFVDNSLQLYIADRKNDRIQLFKPNERSGTTVAGYGTETIQLNEPTAVVLDGNNYLFIVDSKNSRIIGQSSSGFHCVVGCSNSSGTQMKGPRMLSFDTHGNIYVTDKTGHKVYKFYLSNNSCNVTQSTQQPHITSFIPTEIGKETKSISSTRSSQTQITTSLEDTKTAISINSMYSVSDSIIHQSLFSTIESNLVTISSKVLSLSPIYLSTAYNSSSSTDSTWNISNTLCDKLMPCQHGGSCVNNKNIPDSYICHCPFGFDGDRCQHNIQPCKLDTCWNNGICLNKSMSEFSCLCPHGWTGIHCETMIDYCHNITCQNQGVCRPLLGDYRCECCTSSYSGRHCEIIADSLIIRKMAVKSLTFISIISICMVLGFVVVMDILKYVFHIDPVHYERKQLRLQRAIKKQQNKKKPPVIIRYKYINHPSAISTVEETV